jgi:hypothetical protein
MGKVFRFSWNHSKGRLVSPPEFTQLSPSDPGRSLMQQIAIQISKDSGIKQIPSLLLIAVHYIILLVIIVAYCLIESKSRAFLNGLILLAAPFASFVPIVYAMIRDSPIDMINRYMDDREPVFHDDLSKCGYTMTSLFIRNSRIDGHKYSFFQRNIMGRNFSGFVEFEEKYVKIIERLIEEDVLPNKIHRSIEYETSCKKSKKENDLLKVRQIEIEIEIGKVPYHFETMKLGANYKKPLDNSPINVITFKQANNDIEEHEFKPIIDGSPILIRQRFSDFQ